MKTEMQSIARQYTALVKFCEKYPQLVTTEAKRSDVMVCVHGITPSDEEPLLGFSSREAVLVFDLLGRRRSQWEVRRCTPSHWRLERSIEGVRLWLEITGPSDPIISLLQSDALTFAEGGRRYHEAPVEADDAAALELNAKAAGGSL